MCTEEEKEGMLDVVGCGALILLSLLPSHWTWKEDSKVAKNQQVWSFHCRESLCVLQVALNCTLFLANGLVPSWKIV
jgi:hypothetical protein